MALVISPRSSAQPYPRHASPPTALWLYAPARVTLLSA
jgi:hypothetical protein